MIRINCKRLLGARDLVPVVMELTSSEVEKISEGVLFDMGDNKLLWLVESAWVLIQVLKGESPKQ